MGSAARYISSCRLDSRNHLGKTSGSLLQWSAFTPGPNFTAFKQKQTAGRFSAKQK